MVSSFELHVCNCFLCMQPAIGAMRHYASIIGELCIVGNFLEVRGVRFTKLVDRGVSAEFYDSGMLSH